MRMLLAFVAMAIVLTVTVIPAARAGLAPVDLARVELVPPPDARVPLALRLETSDGSLLGVADAMGGRPTLLLPFDQACRTICGPALSILTGALAATGLQPGRDYRLVLVTIGRRDDAAARAFVAAQASEALVAATTTFTGPPEAVARLLDTVGYRWIPDAENDAVAHPSAFLALAPDGRVTRVLTSLALNPDDLRLALVEAGEGRVGDLGDRLKLLCYGFDAVHGIYTARIEGALRLGGAATVLVLGLAIWGMARRRRRPAGEAA